MSSFLLKNAKIITARSPFNNSRKDILIKKGIIKKIADNIVDEKAQLIESGNLHVSIGWMDLGTQCNEPGFEHRETLNSLSQVAAAGGFTALAVFPNTYPVMDNKSSIQYLLNSTRDHLVDYYPIAAVSKKCEGKEITEMIDLHQHGAVAFSDGQHSISSGGLMLRALQYANSMNGFVIHYPTDSSLNEGDKIHEGTMSTSLGLKGSPALSELLMIERDIQLNAYAEARLISHTLSSKEAVSKLKELKNKNVFASVAYLNLCKTDESLAEFDVNYKVSPPLRAESDKEALKSAIKDGTIDIICSNHVPLEDELKKKEFVYATSGAIGLQTLYAALNTFAKDLSLGKIVTCLAINPRKILNIEIPAIDEGEACNLTIFDPDIEWTLNNDSNASGAKNSPFWNQSLKGKILGIINGKNHHLNNY